MNALIPILSFIGLVLLPGFIACIFFLRHRDRMSPREIQALGKTADEFDAGKQRSFGP